MERLIKSNIGKLRLSSDALNKIHSAVEDHIVDLFKAAVGVAGHAKRQTVNAHDLDFVKSLKKGGLCN